MILLSTSHLRVEVNVDRGAEIVFLGRPGGPNALAYDDWSTPLRAGRSVTYGSTMLDWHSEYRGGWQELFPSVSRNASVK